MFSMIYHPCPFINLLCFLANSFGKVQSVSDILGRPSAVKNGQMHPRRKAGDINKQNKNVPREGEPARGRGWGGRGVGGAQHLQSLLPIHSLAQNMEAKAGSWRAYFSFPLLSFEMQSRLVVKWTSRSSSCLCLTNAGIKNRHCEAWLGPHLVLQCPWRGVS